MPLAACLSVCLSVHSFRIRSSVHRHSTGAARRGEQVRRASRAIRYVMNASTSVSVRRTITSSAAAAAAAGGPVEILSFLTNRILADRAFGGTYPFVTGAGLCVYAGVCQELTVVLGAHMPQL